MTTWGSTSKQKLLFIVGSRFETTLLLHSLQDLQYSPFTYLEIAVSICIWVEIYDITPTYSWVATTTIPWLPSPRKAHLIYIVYKPGKYVENILLVFCAIYRLPTPSLHSTAWDWKDDHHPIPKEIEGKPVSYRNGGIVYRLLLWQWISETTESLPLECILHINQG